MMRRLLGGALGVLCLLFFGSAVPAGAAPFHATLSIEAGPFGTFTFTGSGFGTSLGPLVTLGPNALSGTETHFLTPSVAPPLTQFFIQVTGNGAGSFTGSPLAGPMGVAGFLGGRSFGGLTIFPFSKLTLTQSGTTGFGIGGTQHGIASGVGFTAVAAPWSTGTAMASGVLASVTYTLTATGFDLRTPSGLGLVQFVTPYLVTTSNAGTLPMVGVLNVEFVPEPGGALLAAVGLGLVLAGDRRRRRAARR